VGVMPAGINQSGQILLNNPNSGNVYLVSPVSPVSPPTPPSVVSGTPSVSTITPQTFTFTGRDPDGYSDIYRMYFLVNPTAEIPVNTCHGYYDRASNGLYLYNDALTVAMGPLTPGSSATLQNGQCVVYGSSSVLLSAAG